MTSISFRKFNMCTVCFSLSVLPRFLMLAAVSPAHSPSSARGPLGSDHAYKEIMAPESAPKGQPYGTMTIHGGARVHAFDPRMR